MRKQHIQAIVGACFAVALLSMQASPVCGDPSPPPISDQYVLDHGYRYPSDLEMGERSAIRRADSVLLFAHRDLESDRIVGYRRHLDGREIDANGMDLVPRSIDVGPFDLSPYDGEGWKLAHLSDPFDDGREHRSLWVRAVDSADPGIPGAAVLVSESDSEGFFCPTVGWTGSHHVVAWLQGSRDDNEVLLTRVTRDLEVVDEEPIQVATGSAADHLAVGQDERGGLLLWADSGQTLWAVPLDDEGRPAGDSVAVTQIPQPSAAVWSVCRHGENWLAVWSAESGGVAGALLDDEGELLPPGLIDLALNNYPMEIVVVSNGTVGLAAWRFEWGDEIHAARISEDGEYIDGELIAEDQAYVRPEYPDCDRRNLGGAVTDGGFVLGWCTLPDLPVAKERFLWSDEEFRQVYAAWVPTEGDPDPEPTLISHQSLRGPSGVHYAGGSYLALMHESVRDYFIHSFVLGYEGAPLVPPARYDSPSDPDGCTYGGECDSDGIDRLRMRAWGEDALLSYGYAHHHSSWWDPVSYDRTAVYVDRVDPEGTLLRSIRVDVDHAYEGEEPVFYVRELDVAASEDRLFVAYSMSQHGGETVYTRAELVDGDGARLHRWNVVADASAVSPTVASLGSRALMIWLERRDATVLMHTTLDPDDPEEGIEGSVLVGQFEEMGTPYLVPGPNQILCLFTGRSEGETGHDVYAMRFGTDGLPIDPTPFRVSGIPDDEGNVRGVWDNNQYLASWGVLDGPANGIYGARIGANGSVLDEVPFLIAPDEPGPARMASDPAGIVAVVYGGDRLRYIEDTIPVPVLDDPEEEEEETGPAAVRIGRVQPNPALGEMRLDLDLPAGEDARITVVDPAGRVVARATASGPLQGAVPVWDGRSADGRACPAGVYFLRIE
ncbi:MAG: hypothetical protein GF346_03405, partial [Candidatus Eisenbacteria bacterium]|nr:hypothetical protein [Candidatus Latescibacterota bacterium]MBD3301469.1 hypothetical protein [Candidatus Eisenbacteria bacterium]